MDISVQMAIAIIAAVLFIPFVINFVRKKGFFYAKNVCHTSSTSLVHLKTLKMNGNQDGILNVSIERLPAKIDIKENSLFEITDHLMVSRISVSYYSQRI